MADVQFQDNSIKVMNAMEDIAVAFLHEAGGEFEAQAKRNSRVDSGQTKGSWQYTVDENKLEAVVGSPLENAIWEELGTGEHALEGNGRKGGWYYVDNDGNGHFTYGKKPSRALWNAFSSLKSKVISRAEQLFRGLNGK